MKRGLLVALLFLLPICARAETINAGFVQGLWFSKQPIFVGDTVRIYVAVRNNTDGDLTGRVSFYDNNDRFSKMDISALNGRIVEAWADWTPSYGEHELQANLTQLELDIVGQSKIDADTGEALAQTDVFIDYDTDGDNIGNTVDEDDDGDGISDEDEEANGTDPLVYDETEDKEEDSGDEDGDEDTGGGKATAPETTESDSSQGLEQYLTDSRAKDALTTFTNTVNNTKTQLDTYRSNRDATITEKQNEGETDNDTAAPEGVMLTGNSTGTVVGDITRTQHDAPGIVKKTWQKTVTLTTTGISKLYTLLLSGTSAALGKPMLLQILLLIIILLIIIRTAQKLARRHDK